MSNKNDYEDYDDYDSDDYNYDDFGESFGKSKDRRKPKGRQSLNALSTNATDTEKTQKFDDFGLQNLYELGLLDELHSEIKSGKEATVYLAKNAQGLLAVKLYRDAVVRSFKNDQIYTQGRFISSARRKRVMNIAGKSNLDPKLALWVQHEYDQLWALYDAGIRTPKPFLGPRGQELALAGRAVIMEYLGDENSPAPRLAEAALNPDELADAFAQSFTMLKQMLMLGKIHGDFSTFNILWWQDKAYVIDFPQMVNAADNKQAFDLLKQDIASLCQSFQAMGHDCDPVKMMKDLEAAVDFQQLFLKPSFLS